MTTVTKTPVTLLNNVTGAAGSSKGSPGVTSGWIDLSAADGGDLGLAILNNGALGSAATLLIQWSPDGGATFYDYQSMTGDTSAYNATTGAGLTTQTVWIDPGIRYVNVKGYGNTTSSVTFGATFSGVTRA